MSVIVEVSEKTTKFYEDRAFVLKFVSPQVKTAITFSDNATYESRIKRFIAAVEQGCAEMIFADTSLAVTETAVVITALTESGEGDDCPFSVISVEFDIVVKPYLIRAMQELLVIMRRPEPTMERSAGRSRVHAHHDVDLY